MGYAREFVQELGFRLLAALLEVTLYIRDGLQARDQIVVEDGKVGERLGLRFLLSNLSSVVHLNVNGHIIPPSFPPQESCRGTDTPSRAVYSSP
jgi:hypothetical protein